MEFKTTTKIGINPTHGKRSELTASFENMSDFIAHLQVLCRCCHKLIHKR